MSNFLTIFNVFFSNSGSNEIIGRALVGSDKNLPQQNRAMFDDLLRSKSATATAQWLSLTEPSPQ